jgi:hypothetical protein
MMPDQEVDRGRSDAVDQADADFVQVSNRIRGRTIPGISQT